MSVYTIQPSFSGGEFSPSLYSRIDVQKYGTGLKKLRNFIVHPHGGASNRGGLMFVKQTKIPTKKCRIIPFEFSLQQKFILEFGENYVRFIKDDGYVLTGLGATCEVVTTYGENDLAAIKYIQSNDVIFLFHPSFPTKRLTRYADNSWVFDNFPFVNGPFMPEKRNTVFTVLPRPPSGGPPSGLMLSGYPVRMTSFVSFFLAGHVNSLVRVNQFTQSASFSQTVTGNIYVPVMELVAKGTWRLATRGTWAGKISVLRSAPGSYVGWEVIKTFSHNSVDYNIDAFGTEDDLCRMAIGMDLWGGGTCYVDMSCDSYTTPGVVKITNVIDPVTAEGEVVSALSCYQDVLTWQEGSWSAIRGYPSCGAFYQDRFVTAATPAEPQTTWTSKTGNYVDFGVTFPLEDADAVSVNLPSRKMNGIKNLVALAEILAFTSATECGIGETGGVFSPTTVKTKVYGYRGSSGVDPAVVGNRAITVQSMGSVVRDFGYDYAVDGFTGSDLSIFSTHLFKNYSIIEMAYQQEPDSLVWFVRSDGKALSMTYMKEQEVVAWSWHETDGLIEGVCSIPGDGQNDIYFVVNRDGKRNIEKLGKRLPVEKVAEAFFLDSALTYRGAATTTISGLTHLNGKTVTALADGNVVKGLVVSAGVITLPHSAGLVHVGLPYVSDIQTLSVQVPMQDGTGYGRLVKIPEARFTFLNSRGGFIGPDEGNLDEIIDLAGGSLGDPRGLFSGEYRQTLGSNYDPGGTVFFRQADPLPVTILSIMPKVTIGG